MTASGSVHEYQLPAGADGVAAPQGLVVGPGPFVWATDYLNGQIDRLDTRTGAVLVYPVPTPESGPVGMVRGPDGALWFVERTTGKLGRLSPRGRFVEWTLPAGAFPNRIIVGPDHRIWFTELGTNQLGRIGSNWRLMQSPLPGGAVGITRSPDGSVYVALNSTGQLARLSDAGRDRPDVGFARQHRRSAAGRAQPGTRLGHRSVRRPGLRGGGGPRMSRTSDPVCRRGRNRGSPWPPRSRPPAMSAVAAAAGPARCRSSAGRRSWPRR